MLETRKISFSLLDVLSELFERYKIYENAVKRESTYESFGVENAEKKSHIKFACVYVHPPLSLTSPSMRESCVPDSSSIRYIYMYI